jgi:hypothetical protein
LSQAIAWRVMGQRVLVEPGAEASVHEAHRVSVLSFTPVPAARFAAQVLTRTRASAFSCLVARLARAAEMAYLQAIYDSETRTRTGDTTIFRRAALAAE